MDPIPIVEIAAKRQKTDRSLHIEREKTDQTLFTVFEAKEENIDQTVDQGRSEVDQKLEAARAKADADARKSDEDRLLEERRRADKAIERERAIADHAIEEERHIKRDLGEKILSSERAQTDRSLHEERIKTDAAVHDEIAAHSQTRVSLTTRDEFLAIVSHDLRNPVGAIISCSEMLLEDITDKQAASEDLKQWVEIIHRCANTAMRLIEDLLDIERLAKGKFQLKMASHSLDKVILESVRAVQTEAEAKDIEIRVAPSSRSEFVFCDIDRVRQILGNLLGNAIKFTSSGGLVEISTAWMPNEVQVLIKDSGPGIPPEKFERIFDRFAQIHSQERRGLGLGLYISRMLVNAQGGRIWVNSRVGEGSTFIFTIPRH
jgi:signal transduction histidine kinase